MKFQNYQIRFFFVPLCYFFSNYVFLRPPSGLYINILLVFCLSFYAYYYCYYIQLQFLFIKFLRIFLPENIQFYRNNVWDELIAEAENFPKKKTEFLEKKKVTFFETFFLYIYIFFVWFRLFLFQKPLVYLVSYVIFFLILFFNNQFFIFRFLSFFVLISKLCFFLCCENIIEYKFCMQVFCDEDITSSNIKISTSLKNAVIFSFFNLSLLNKQNYNIFLLRNELDNIFVFILISDFFMTLGWLRKKIEIDYKKKE